MQKYANSEQSEVKVDTTITEGSFSHNKGDDLIFETAVAAYTMYDNETKMGYACERTDYWVESNGDLRVVSGPADNRIYTFVDLPATVLIKMLALRMEVEIAGG